MNPNKRRVELPPHLAERRGERCAPPDQHVIVTTAQGFAPKALAFRQPHHFAQAPPHPVALHRIADLPRHRKADARRTVLGAAPRLYRERRAGRPHSGGRSAKVGPPSQAFHRGSLRSSLGSSLGASFGQAGARLSGAEPLAPAGATGRQHFATALGRHAGAEAMPAFAHQFARLVGPFHGIDLRKGARPGLHSVGRRSIGHRFRQPVGQVDGRQWKVSRCAIGAAYTQALPARQCERPGDIFMTDRGFPGFFRAFRRGAGAASQSGRE